MQCLRISMEAKRRVQKGIEIEEKEKLTFCIETLRELEDYYTKNR